MNESIIKTKQTRSELLMLKSYFEVEFKKNQFAAEKLQEAIALIDRVIEEETERLMTDPETGKHVTYCRCENAKRNRGRNMEQNNKWVLKTPYIVAESNSLDGFIITIGFELLDETAHKLKEAIKEAEYISNLIINKAGKFIFTNLIP